MSSRIMRFIFQSRRLSFGAIVIVFGLFLVYLVPANAGHPRDVYFVDSQHGWVVGGLALHTSDGGNSWEELPFPIFGYGVYFINLMEGWAVGGAWSGNNYVIIHTNDGGETWTEQASGEGSILADVHFVDSQKGWAVGGATVDVFFGGKFGGHPIILHTEDGGNTWEQQPILVSDEALLGVHFVNAQEGWIVGGFQGEENASGVILHTTNGGESWELQAADTESIFSDVYFADSQEGWVVGGSLENCVIKYTKDGGLNWDTQIESIPGFLHAILMGSGHQKEGWVVGGGALSSDEPYRGGLVFHTGDGVNWAPQDLSDFIIYPLWWEGEPYSGASLSGVGGVAGGTVWVTSVNAELIEITGVIPHIQITSPPPGETPVVDEFLITWYDYDTDDDATITLYYDTDDSGYDGIQIDTSDQYPDGISEDDETDSYSWNTSSVPEGSYYIYAKIEDGTYTRYDYSPGKVKVLPPYGTISGKVVDSLTGDGISGAKVSADGYETYTDENGNYTLSDLPVGTYTVTASAAGYYPDSQDDVIPGDIVNFVLTLITGTISGKVIDSSTGDGISDAKVLADSDETDSGKKASDQTYTDENGNYTLSNLPIGTYTVTASTAGYYPNFQSDVSVIPEDTTIVNLELTPIGNWCELDGVDDYAEAADSTSLDVGDEPDEDLTIEAWVYPRAFPIAGYSRGIVSKQGAYELSLIAERSPSGLSIWLGFKFTVYSGPVAYHISRYGPKYERDTWYHIAGVFDNSTNKIALYINGEQTIPGSFDYNLNNSSGSFYVGRPQDSLPSDLFFDGKIDEIRVSDVARYSVDFIPSGPFTPDENTRALWHFDEPIGSTVFFDSSGNNNTLTGVNGAHTGGKFAVGDVSGNGYITAYDASLVLQHIVGLITLSPEQQQAADVTGDDTVTALDAAFILQYCVRLITEFPKEQPSIAPVLYPRSQDKFLIEAIEELEAASLNREQRKVLEQLKQLVFQRLLPVHSILLQNFPNPFNPETWIPFELAKSAEVTIRIYNLKGQLIRRLDLGKQKAGTYTSKNRAAYWDGRNANGEYVSSGVYFYTLQAGKFRATRKMVILK